MDFDISSGKASETLQEAAVQADVQILFAAGIPKGVITRSIHGEYTVQEALDNMLSGTPLVAVPVSAGKAFGILRRATDKDQRASLSDRQQKTRETTTRTNMKLSQTKKRKSLRNLISGLAALSVAQSSVLFAQDDEEVVELSPFIVEASENEGYRATTTLAGTRIKSNLADVGSAISVLTAEVFKDTGATDAETILPYSLNVEVAGVQGNFADVSSAGGQRLRSNSTARNGNSTTRVRGLSPAIYARGLFQTDIPFDSYNTSRVTINRGPNSLLFGATTPGGVIDQSLNKASLGGDSGSIEFRIGERYSRRFAFDFNKVIIEDRLALRVSLLDNETNYQQKPTFKRDRRVYADTHAVLYKGSDGGILGRTSLRGNVEIGEIEGTPPKITPPGDGLSGWFEPPSRELEQYTGATLPDNWVEGFQFKHTIDNRDGSVNETNQPVLVSRPFFINMSLYYAQPNFQAPSMGLPGFPEVAGMPARTLWRGESGFPFRQDTWATFPILGRGDFAPGFTVPTINDRRVFDNQNISVAGSVPYRNTDFDVQSIALEQEFFGGKGGIELAYDRQSFDNAYYDPFGGGSFQGNAFRGNEIRIDISEYLTNGDPNHNLGRPFMVDFTTPHFTRGTERESKRLTAFYELDFADKDGFLGKLGRHVFTGFLSEDTAEITNTSSRNKWINTTPGSPWDIRNVVNDRLNGERRNVPLIVYLGESLLGSDVQSVSDVSITHYADFPVTQSGDVALNWFHPFFRTPVNTVGPAAPLNAETFEIYRSLNSGSIRRTENDAKSLGWQSFFFGGNLVGLLGWRDDAVRTIENISLTNFVEETSDANADGLLDSGEFDARRIRLSDPSNPDHAGEISDISDETITWSVVGHLPENLLKLPGGSRLSLHYNESESFVPTRTRRDFNGDEIAPESGSTTEYGFTFATRNGRLSARVNWFELEQSNATATGGPGAPGMVGWLRFWRDAEIAGIPFDDALSTGLDERPVLTPDITNYADMYDAIINLLPQTQRDLYNVRFGPDGRTPVFDANPGQAVTTNAIADGFEIDIAGSITENWSVILNYGKQETVTSDSAPVAGDFVLAVAENLASTGLDVVTFVPSLFEYNSMGNNWNGNVNNLNALRGKDGTVSLEQRKERINLISTYSFLDESRFKGLTVGGALRWQSEIATGYETEVNDGVVTPIVSKPFLGPDELNGDAWISYERQLGLRDRPIDWKIQLNVRNLIGGDDYIPVVTNPDGTVAVVRNPPTREVFLTNSFSF